jgi:hypothetical protein
MATIDNFGVGYLFGRRTDVANSTPYQFAVLQDFDLSIDRTLKELMGQFQYPVDVAVGPGKITGKAKQADFNAVMFNDLFLGQTLATGSGEQDAVNEVHAIPGTPFQITAAPPGGGTFVHDLGVIFQATGVPLKKVASAPTTGQYSVTEPAGVYTFAAADTTLSVLISYSYTSSTLTQISIANLLMGPGPTFELHQQLAYTTPGGTQNVYNMVLNQCRAGKLQLPFKNVDFTLFDFELQAFADAAGNIGKLTLVR